MRGGEVWLFLWLFLVGCSSQELLTLFLAPILDTMIEVIRSSETSVLNKNHAA
jgi:hypothetical protein